MRGDGHIALVTGGASGLGKAIALRLAREGAIVIISDLEAEKGQRVALEGGLSYLEQDVSNEARWPQIIRHIEEHFGRLTTLVNNAGIMGSLTAADPQTTELADWRRIFSVNVEGAFLGCRAAIGAMRRSGRGSIINIASIADRLATPHATAYGASKAAVRHLTRSVAQYCAQERLNIRCNSVHPGVIRTALVDASIEEVSRTSGASIEQVAAEFKAAIPCGDFTLPEDIAIAVSFLASDEARHITGSAVIVDGGITHCNTYRASRAGHGSAS